MSEVQRDTTATNADEGLAPARGTVADAGVEKLPMDGHALTAERQIDTKGRNLREHAAQGVMINTGFQVGLAGVGLMRRLLIAAFLTQAEFGLWGILVSTIITLAGLKQVGVGDKYIQQNEPDQELAYQKAFTLELGLSTIFFLLVAAVLPLYATGYGHPEIILPGILLAASVPISAFETPTWIAYRRMQFVRQRTLIAIDPLVAFVVTIAMGLLGFGYWSLVTGAVAGSVVGGIAATATSPYPLRLRWDRATLNEYTRFSWPLMGLSVSNLITIQGALLVANQKVGLAGIGSIGLAAGIASFADRVDGIVSQAIYPAVCATAHRRDVLKETFIKSNRVILMWAIPFSFGLALFAGDLVTFVLGEQWRSAVGLLTAVGLIVGLTQVAFNWSVFMRAVNNTKPMFLASLVNLATFGFVMVPALLLWGLNGYVVGLTATVSLQIAMRGYFLGQLFDGFNVIRHLFRGIAPSVPAAGLVLLIRFFDAGDRGLAWALGELTVYAVATIVFTVLFERRLVVEMLGYVARRRSGTRVETSPDGVPQGT